MATIYTLPAVGAGSEPPEPLSLQIERALIGTDQPNVPGNTEKDKEWAYSRSVPTLVLYDEAGLRLYDRITADASEYYLFDDELNLLKTHGNAIARAMGFPKKKKYKFENEDDNVHQHPMRRWRQARWGDTEVGRWNHGVNGEEGLGASDEQHGWDVVELGAGALRKTAHLLTALADTVSPASEGKEPITYHALDLSRPELNRVLEQMDEAFGASFAGRVACVGLHGDYNAGLQLVRDGALHTLSLNASENGSPPLLHSSADSPPSSPLSACLVTPAMESTPLPAGIADQDSELVSELGLGASLKVGAVEYHGDHPSIEAPAPDSRPLHFVFLGSSLGNFEREDAGPFLRSLPLRPGDTLLLGLDGRPAPGPEGTRKVEVAYNDPAGHTRAFEEHGWDVARTELGLQPDDGVEFVGRYNEPLGRHEAYFRATRGQNIHLSAHKRDVELKAGELLHVEWSYKYSLSEALKLFDDAELRVVDSWKAPDSEYRLWLLERPVVRFQEIAPCPSWPSSVPTWEQWQAMWKLWDQFVPDTAKLTSSITLEMIPKEMLHTKPIDLRHICLFYLGHIPTFLDIYLTRITDGVHTSPQVFKDIFERGIDPDVDDPTQIHPHSDVPTAEDDWPALQEIVDFRDAVRARLRKIYDELEDGGKVLTRREARSIFMGYEHEAMHAETLLYMLLQSPMTRVPCASPDWEELSQHWPVATNRKIRVGATAVTLGHDDAESDDTKPLDDKHEMGWDNEHPQHKVNVETFSVDALPVTNEEYLAFFTKKTTGAAAPASWVEVDGEWHVRSLFGPVSMQVAGKWPLMASRDELVAFAKSKGGRLPTEAELRALWAHPDGPRPAGLGANIGFKNWHPVPPTASVHDNAGVMIHGHNGGVWEWTSTPFEPYEGYEASKLYPGYSSDFFDGKHFVVLGGSFATVPQIASRTSFRNWYQSNYRFAWVGGRVAYDA